MPLQKLVFRPGVNRDQTSYAGEGGWYDADKVRFRDGFPESIGGWATKSAARYKGSARWLHDWSGLDSSYYIGVGTHQKLYVEHGGGLYDITPIRRTANLGADPLETELPNRLIVTDNSHGAIVGDFVTLSGATGFGGLPAGAINAEHEIVEVSANSYVVEVSGISSETTGGGSAPVVATYQINSGLDTAVLGTGWGAGTYGRGTWGSAANTALTGGQIRLWSGDNFGEDLVACARDGGIYYWDATGGLAARAVSLSALDGASDVPTVARQVLVSAGDRTCIAYGANPLGSSTQDPMLIRWSNQEDIANWTPGPTTSAGEYRLPTGSKFLRAIRGRQETIIFTDRSLYGQQFTGAPYVFSFTQLADGVSIIGPMAAAQAAGVIFWMGPDHFYAYDGHITSIPCPVRSYVFDEMTRSQSTKVIAAPNARLNEMWWFFPAENSNENNRYVIYNYVDKWWSIGELTRTAWLDSLISSYPLAAGDNRLYHQEYGQNDENGPMTSFVESADLDISANGADGERFMFITRLIPDIAFRGPAGTKSAAVSLKRRDYPFQTSTTGATVTIVDGSPNVGYVRLRGRQIALRVEGSTSHSGWRLGSVRVDARPDGRR
jgi:hypothetical protein